MCISAATKTRHVILDFDMVSEIITFEPKGGFGKEKYQIVISSRGGMIEEIKN